VLPGVLVAVGVAMLQLLAKTSHPNDAVLGRIPGTDGYHDIKDRPEAETIPGLLIFRFDAPLLFFNSDHFKSRVRAVVKGVKTEVRCLVLDAGTMPNIDSTGAACIGEVCNELTEKGIVFAIAQAKGPLRGLLDRTGIKQQIGPDRLFPTLESAVEAMRSTLASSDRPVKAEAEDRVGSRKMTRRRR
jgi:SulP family sulfate permease